MSRRAEFWIWYHCGGLLDKICDISHHAIALFQAESKLLSVCFMSVKFEPSDLDGQEWKPAALKAAASVYSAGLGIKTPQKIMVRVAETRQH